MISASQWVQMKSFLGDVIQKKKTPMGACDWFVYVNTVTNTGKWKVSVIKWFLFVLLSCSEEPGESPNLIIWVTEGPKKIVLDLQLEEF